MTISIGDTLPDATLLIFGANGPEAVKMADKTRGRKVVIFGLPGAYTRTCTAAHVPSFIRTKGDFDAKGIANEKTVVEIRKTLTEIEAIDTDIIARRIEADHPRLAYPAKQMQLVIAAQTYVETGEVTGFLETLRAISGE